MSEKKRERSVRISLVDMMYGIVLAYGFTFFDNANSSVDYFRFFFAYFIIIIDWLYVHNLYWGWEYEHNFIFLLDLSIIFSMSRLIHTSVSGGDFTFWFWLALLFFFYLIWDILSRYKKLPSEYDWRFSIAGDLFGVIFYVIFFILFFEDVLPSTILWNVIMFIVYIGVVFTWFKKNPKKSDLVGL